MSRSWLTEHWGEKEVISIFLSCIHCYLKPDNGLECVGVETDVLWFLICATLKIVKAAQMWSKYISMSFAAPHDKKIGAITKCSNRLCCFTAVDIYYLVLLSLLSQPHADDGESGEIMLHLVQHSWIACPVASCHSWIAHSVTSNSRQDKRFSSGRNAICLDPSFLSPWALPVCS